MLVDKERLALGALARFIGFANSEKAELMGAGRPVVRFNATPLDRLLERRPRVLWVGAHPDDESFAGALLAKAGLRCQCPLHFLVLTRGEGGECALPNGPATDLGAVRAQEVSRVAELYGATIEVEQFFNAPIPVSSFPYRHELAQRWLDYKDPVTVIAGTIRAFRPDVVLTFAPDYGSTGHPEHQLTSRFTTAAIRLAAQPTRRVAGSAHRVDHCYYVLNKYWFTRLAGMGFDPLPYSERFPVRQPCVAGLTCADFMAENSRPHLTQANDMGMMRVVAKSIHNLYLYRADPFVDVKDPFEPHFVRGMG
jgi:LmbE family N-acetylglucosaminyl deacetylase